jgi:uncharacterized protein YjbJ (UPF0337 family)
MNRQICAGRWKQWRGTLKEALGRVINNRLLEFDGQQDRLNGRIQVRSGRLGRAGNTGAARTLMVGRKSRSA